MGSSILDGEITKAHSVKEKNEQKSVKWRIKHANVWAESIPVQMQNECRP